MSYLLWQRDGDLGIVSRRRVLAAAEVGPLREAQALCARAAEIVRLRAAEADAEADAARLAARAEGLAAGRREARDEVAAALAALVAASAAELDRLRDEVGQLALDVVRRILAEFAPEVVLGALARAALRDVLPAPAVTLVVHPERATALRQEFQCEAATARTAASTGEASHDVRVEVRADPDCALDDCRLETPYGVVDAALETQLARIAAAWSLG